VCRHAISACLALCLLAAPMVRADEYEDFAALEKLYMSHSDAGRYREAAVAAQRLVTMSERIYRDDPKVIANSLNLLACTYHYQARNAEAEKLHRRALAMRKQVLGEQDLAVAESLLNLSNVCESQDRHQEAELLLRQALAIHQKNDVLEHRNVASIFNNLALACRRQGRVAEAEEFHKQALALLQKLLGTGHMDVARSLNNLGLIYDDQARYGEAEALFKRSVAIAEAAARADHPVVASGLVNLAGVYQAQSRYAEASPLLHRALAMTKRIYGPEHPEVATALNNLALLSTAQGRFNEAASLHERALAIRRKALPANHPHVAMSLSSLANAYRQAGRTDEAEPLMKEALQIREIAFGGDHPTFSQSAMNLGLLYVDLARYDEAESLLRRALAIHEKAHQADPAEFAHTLMALGELYRLRQRYDDAMKFNDRSIGLIEQSKTIIRGGFMYYEQRSSLLWELGRKTDAIATLEHALDIAERQRTQGAGAETDQARNFGQYAGVFETMVAWQAELGDVGRAFDACERSRARTLIDQRALEGADPLVGVPAPEAARLRQRLLNAKRRVAALEQQLLVLSAESADESLRLETALKEGREALFDAYRDVQMANPTYRLSVAGDFKPAGMAEMQSWLQRTDAMALEYFFGGEAGYVFIIPSEGEPRLEKLTVGDEHAKALGVEAGELTAASLQQMMTVDGTEIPKLLSDPVTAPRAIDRLAALWTFLIPESERQKLSSGGLKELVVIPDGALALLPFETLVVEPGASPKFLLDVGPPVLYAPSATVLLNLAERPSVKNETKSAAQPVLTIANPIYGGPQRTAPAPASALDALAARSRYGAVGGHLAPLPHTGTESTWVTDVYKKQGIASAGLLAGLATEANVRFNMPGRRVLHFACHGLADQEYGNFFGALALTPGKQGAANPADDGFLTLPEIYELNLKSCELAILSACETNYGPQQQGEGVWALSRGFLVAGARRVVASNWLVDDEAAASLVSYFCGGIAKADAKGEAANHAKALHDAKRWVRQQEKWSSPYYWGTFVLVGPN
jgi:CHAT domain-containing protein/tetratricopeptide (TPR) repeat protein